MNIIIFDVEGNGFLENITKLHCLVTLNLGTGQLRKFGPDEVEEGVRSLLEADLLVGHNAIKYDLAVIQKLYTWFAYPREQVVDTLVLSRLLFSDLRDRDFNDRAKFSLDGKLIGSHSLKAWGQRLGFPKGEYTGGFETFSHEMLDYNVRDVQVTARLYDMLRTHPAFEAFASEIEHAVAFIVAQQERYGFTFDMPAACELARDLMVRRSELNDAVQSVFPPWVQDIGWFTPKVNNAARGYVKGVPFMRTKEVVFNPNSRAHITNRLKALYGWEPRQFTPDGSAKIDDDVLSALPYPEAKLLAEYFLVQKRLGMLTDGKAAWMKKVRNGRIHGECITNGAVTGRATHKDPNIAQVPSVGAPYGKQCRALFGPSKGRVQVGVDVSGLELRMLAHFMYPYDKGAYAREVVDGDVHTANQLAAGLETRSQAKTFIYAFLYGAGNEKIGSIVGKGAVEGGRLKARFLKRTPALATLLAKVKLAAKRGYLLGLDRRRLAIRSLHAALNTLLQSAGALICKLWMVELDKAITERNWNGRVQQLAWVHDELQFECDPDIAEEFGRVAVDCIARAGLIFQIKVPLTGEFKIGQNWAETH